MFCVNCGKQIDDDSTFCPFCGANTEDGSLPSEQPKTESVSVNQQASPQNQPYIQPQAHQVSSTQVVQTPAKKSSLPFLVVCLLLVLILGGGGFFLYKNVLNKDADSSDEQIENLTEEDVVTALENEETAPSEETAETISQEEAVSEEPIQEQQASYTYTVDELCGMAINFYEAKKGERPAKAEGTDNHDGTCTIHLSGTTSGGALSEWYTVSMDTAKGSDDLKGKEIDLTDLTVEALEVSADGDYVLPDSDTRAYTKAELSKLSPDELRIARNEIFARHGRKFNDESLQSYFDSKSWYEGLYSPSEFDSKMMKSLNEYEYANLDLIKELE